MNLKQPRMKPKPLLGPESLAALTQTRARITHDVNKTTLTSNTASRDDPSGSWNTLEVQRKYLLQLPTDRLVQIALDLSPQVNKGLWDFLRFSNPGYVINIENKNSKKIIDDFIEQMSIIYGSFDVMLDRMFASLFIGGAFFLELVIDDEGRNAINIAIIDPVMARYRRREEQPLGQYWELGQAGRNSGDFLSLTGNPRIKYLPIDTLPDKPYGRPMISSSIYASIFLLGLIQDLRRVIANQGLSRTDYSIKSEELLKLIEQAGDNIAGDDAKTAAFIKKHITDVENALGNLEVDSNYVHLDTVEVNYADSGTSQTMPGVDTLVRTLERQITNGLKSIPLLMGSNEAVAETHANRQLEFYLAAVTSMQDELTSILEKFFSIALQLQGKSDEVTFSFRKLRATDKKTIAETEKIQIENIITKRDAELITPKQAILESEAVTDPLQIR